jgi:Na+-translocating ferredoxin:NAD+ oxidoreductase RnfG subunit
MVTRTSLTLAVVAALASPPAICTQYMTAQQVLTSCFPAATRFEAVPTLLDKQQLDALLAAAGPQPLHGRLQVFRAWAQSAPLGYVLFDEVLGREQMISYAVAIDGQGTLGVPEVLAYRENHGQGVRFEYWRRQFAGRSSLDALRFRRDIKNIAGGTISAEHVTQGMRWLLAYYQLHLQTARP